MRTRISPSFEDRLLALVARSDATMGALQAARELGLRSWCIGAGAIRSLVWDHLHGFDRQTAPADLDLVFYDAEDLSNDRERSLERALSAKVPGVTWEVVNQAAVHQWFLSHHAQTVPPLASLSEGIATWPEFATCVGVTLTDSGALEVIAPHGLADLFEMVVRWNPLRATRAMYLERVAQKRFAERWPKVQVLGC